MDYFERAYNELNREMSKGISYKNSPTNPPRRFNFGKLNPTTPMFYLVLLLVVFVFLILSKPQIVKQKDKVSVVKVLISSVLITSPWLVWYYYKRC